MVYLDKKRFLDVELGGERLKTLPLYMEVTEADLVMISIWLATHTFEGLSLLAVLTLVVTVVFGRVFCGWFCPLGTLNNIIGSFRQSFRRITRQKEGFSRWQRAKYFVLVAMLAMSAAGAQWMGVLDPFSLLYRSIALTVMPSEFV